MRTRRQLTLLIVLGVLLMNPGNGHTAEDKDAPLLKTLHQLQDEAALTRPLIERLLQVRLTEREDHGNRHFSIWIGRPASGSATKDWIAEVEWREPRVKTKGPFLIIRLTDKAGVTGRTVAKSFGKPQRVAPGSTHPTKGHDSTTLTYDLKSSILRFKCATRAPQTCTLVSVDQTHRAPGKAKP